MVDYNSIKQHLLSAAMILAPTGKEQSAISHSIQDIEKHEPNSRTRVLHILSIMIDGLQYGNWPNIDR